MKIGDIMHLFKNTVLATLCAFNVSVGAGSAQAEANSNQTTGLYDWSGLYAGVHLAYGKGRANWQEILETGGVAFDDTITGAGQRPIDRPDGIIGGGQIGYAFQFGNFVVGPEVTLSASNLRDRSVSTFGVADDRYRADINLIFTATARAGYSFDRFLVYAKGGYAGADINLGIVDTTGGTGSWNKSAWQSGFVVGAGVDYALSEKLVVGVEYNYLDLGSKSFTSQAIDNGAPSGSLTFRNKAKIHTIGLRASWKF
ncbi:hypothetical protein MNBD_ALPHA07-2162 [hydrothermal vent metagenome]|uniref:Outer membrane protein beta-barrel domain-containing protein n=1 Tax=hydrothermal vent metagenome TaxID=652676 RepID=A0A3B0RUQ4_9ZZZZ